MPPLPWFVHATARKPDQGRSEGNWQQGLQPAWIRLIERLNRDAMAPYGYAPAELAHEPGWLAAQAGRCSPTLPHMFSAGYRLLSFGRRLDRHFQARPRFWIRRRPETNVSQNPAAWRHYPGFQLPPVPKVG